MPTRVRDWGKVDFYAALGVEATASDDEIVRAYRTLAKQLHPDAGATPAEVEQFKIVTDAYEVLGDPHVRREYDRVRVAELTLVRGPVPGRRAAPPRRTEFTRRRAWIALVAGVVVTIAAVAVAYLTWSLRARDADERAGTVAVTAVRSEIDGVAHVTFEANGERVTVPEPPRSEAGVVGTVVKVRYDPDDPHRVVADEDHTPRDITLAIVALKLLVGGPVFVGLGARRLARGA